MVNISIGDADWYFRSKNRSILETKNDHARAGTHPVGEVQSGCGYRYLQQRSSHSIDQRQVTRFKFSRRGKHELTADRIAGPTEGMEPLYLIAELSGQVKNERIRCDTPHIIRDGVTVCPGTQACADEFRTAIVPEDGIRWVAL